MAQLLSVLLEQRPMNFQGVNIREKLSGIGASYNIKNDGIEINCSSEHTEDVVTMLSVYYKIFGFSESFSGSRSILGKQMEIDTLSLERLHQRVSRALLYGGKHPYGEIGTLSSLDSLNISEVAHFYKKTIYPNGTKLFVIGDVYGKTIKKQLGAISKEWRRVLVEKKFNLPVKKNDTLHFSIIDSYYKNYTLIRFQKKVPVVKQKKDYLSLELLSRLLAKDNKGFLFEALKEENKDLFSIQSSFEADNYEQAFVIDMKIANSQVENSVQSILEKIKDIRTKGISDNDLIDVKQYFFNSFIFSAYFDTEKFTNMYLKLDIGKEEKQTYFKGLLDEINAITKNHIDMALEKYLDPNRLNIVMTGDAKVLNVAFSKVVFDNDTIPIRYYDKYAHLVENPTSVRPIPEGVTIETIMNNYINAVGGKANLMAVKTMHTFAETTVRGKKLTLDTKISGNAKYKIDFKINGRLLNFQLINNNKGYIIKQPLSAGGYMVEPAVRKELKGEQIGNIKQGSEMFYELFYKEREYKIQHVETIENKDYYVVRISDVKKAYYDVNTGLKYKEEMKEVEKKDTKLSVKYYDNYKDVNGVKVPFSILQHFGSNTLRFDVKQVEINQNVLEEDFEILDF
ncbi:peptidase M16 [Elysia marginata]|uniref:Peptidase M16 n=1 Tax=Elysia marginata TaxID=1093978 RepID=A0AAV4FXF6_9GAST|nr:peptidase M16 [Elysia marginata]